MPQTARVPANSRAKARARSVEDVRERGFLTNTKATAALVDENKPLTDAQRMFVKFWASGESPASAASRCGLQTNYAYRLIYMPNVLKAYRAEKEAYEQASGMNRKRVIDGFLEAIEIAKTMAEPSTMVAGWREVGKMCGYYEPVQVKHTVTHEGKVLLDRMEKMSDEELFEIIERRMREQTEAQASLGAAQPPLLPIDPGAVNDDLDGAGEDS